MGGDGSGPGPPPDPNPHGLPFRGVPDASQPAAKEHVADLSSPVDAPEAGCQSSVLNIAPLPHFFHARTFAVDRSAPPLRRPIRRAGRVMVVPPGPDVGTGQAHRRHLPLTTHVRVNDVEGTPLSALLDTGASLSVIDRHLLETLGGTVQGRPMRINGLGAAHSLGWASIPFFVDGLDDRGFHVHLECCLDFHVLDAFAPGLCLGQDFIVAHDVVIRARSGQAALRVGDRTVAFAVHEHMPPPFATETPLCTCRGVTVPARSHAWVPVDTSAMAPGLDYTAYPRLSVNATETVRLAGPTALLRRETPAVLVTNLGREDAFLERRTPVADALVARLGEVTAPSVHTFDLPRLERRGEPGAAVPAVLAASAAGADVDVHPLDLCESVEGDLPPPAPDEAPPVLVDECFRVGVDSAGVPHAEVVDVLRRHSAAFALDGRPGRVVGHEMSIDLRDGGALHPEPPRRASPEKQRAMDAAIDQLLDWDVIEPSSSPVSFPVLMVRQYDKWRFCVDYRQLNAQTIPDAYPLPRTDAVFNSLVGKRIFSSLDALRGYHQLGVAPKDRWKTAFTCHRGLFQYRTVPFGLRNAPAVFQRLMDTILGELRWNTAVVYIDDVVVATETMSDHVRALDTLLSRAEAAGLRFSPSKCTFAVSSLVLLGRKVSAAGVAVWEDRARAVQDLRPPRTLRDLYHVVGLFGYYRAFVPRFASLAAPLTRLTQGWRYERQGDRYRLVSAGGQTVSADRQEITWGPEQQHAFDALKLAIASPPVLAHPDPSRPYVLYVDASKQGFGAALHQVFDADDPAAPPSPAAASLNAVASALLPPVLSTERWCAWLRRDRYFGPILRAVELGGEASADWVLDAGRLVRRVDGAFALPEGALPELLRAAHDDGGHFGFTKTYLLLRRHFWRPGLSASVRSWVRHCGTCQATKLHRRTGELDVSRDAGLPFETISLDLLLGFPRSRAGHDAVLVILDVFSRMVLLEPCAASVTAEGVAAIISNRVLRAGWRPRRLVPDSEAKLTGDVMRQLAASLRAELTPSLPHHHQANPAERCIQTVRHVLQALAASSRAHWDRQAVPAAELAINSSPSLSTGMAPFDLVYISHPDVVHAVFESGEHAGVGSFAERLAAAHARLAEAREAIASARSAQKRAYDRSRAPLPALVPGDVVYVRLPDRPMPGPARDKLSAVKQGPFSVAEVLSPHRVRLALPPDLGITDVFDVSQLDAVPGSSDPFGAHRVAPAASEPGTSSRQLPEASSSRPSSRAAPSPPPSPSPRPRRAPVALRDYDVGADAFGLSAALYEELRGPHHRPRRVEVDGRTVCLAERPVAFLSRLTAPAERSLVAAELELCCLAWAFGRWLHLLEGADVTVVTDHSPLGAMLTSASGTRYGPVISRCRALLMPHLGRLRFVHRPGAAHTNADALSRLVGRPGSDDCLAGGM